LNTYSSSSSLSIVVDTILGAGTYYFKIQGVGNNYAPSYAIVGSYSVQGSVTEATLHQLLLTMASEKGKNLLTWTIDPGDAIADQTLEMSTDGKNFSPLVRLVSTDRSYSYTPTTFNSVIYRLHVRLDNNSNHYSNLVATRETDASYRPKLMNRLVENEIISVISPAVFDYAIFDMNGKILKKGTLANGMNAIPAASMISGMYLIGFSDGTDRWTEKFVKQ